MHFVSRNSTIVLAFLFISCRTVKKIETIQTAISKKDTVSNIIVAEIKKIDSTEIVRDILSKVEQNYITFKTFNAKIRVSYEGPEVSEKYTAYVSIERDSTIYITIAGSFLGIPGVGMLAKITKDSVFVIQKRGDKSIKSRSLNYLREVTGIPFDFFHCKI